LSHANRVLFIVERDIVVLDEYITEHILILEDTEVADSDCTAVAIEVLNEVGVGWHFIQCLVKFDLQVRDFRLEPLAWLAIRVAVST